MAGRALYDPCSQSEIETERWQIQRVRRGAQQKDEEKDNDRAGREEHRGELGRDAYSEARGTRSLI